MANRRTLELEAVPLEALGTLTGGQCSVKVYEAYQPGWLAWLGGARATPRMIGISGAGCYSEKALAVDAANGGVQRHGAVVLSEEGRQQYRHARQGFLGR